MSALRIDRVCPEEYSSDTYNLTGSNIRTVSPNQSEGYSENQQEVYSNGKVPDSMGTRR